MLVARKASGVAKCIFGQIEANLAEIQPKNHQNVQKTHFLQKAPGVNELNTLVALMIYQARHLNLRVLVTYNMPCNMMKHLYHPRLFLVQLIWRRINIRTKE